MSTDGKNWAVAGTLADTDHVSDFINMNIGQTVLPHALCYRSGSFLFMESRCFDFAEFNLFLHSDFSLVFDEGHSRFNFGFFRDFGNEIENFGI